MTLKTIEECIDMIEKLKKHSENHSLINESTFSYFPETEEIRPLFSFCTFHLIENYRTANKISYRDDVECFVEYNGFKFSFGENFAPYDQNYIYTKTRKDENYISFEIFFDKYK